MYNGTYKPTVWSGGQTGVDYAALQAAKMFSLPTGGWAPNGWKTLNGPDLRLRDVYGLAECDSPGYKARTYRNVEQSGCTVSLAVDFASPGEICTRNAIKKYNKPHLDVDLGIACDPRTVADFLLQGRYWVVNFAGNSEKTCEGIHIFARTFIAGVFRVLGLKDA